MDSDTKEVEIRHVEGYRMGERVSLPANRAITYARNGQAIPIGWDLPEYKAPLPQESEPRNEMIDTGKDVSGRSRTKRTKKDVRG